MKNNFDLNPNFYMDLMVKYNHSDEYLDEGYIKRNIINHKIIWWRDMLLKLYKYLYDRKSKDNHSFFN